MSLKMYNPSRFTQDETGQWWYLFGKKKPVRTRVYPKPCPECGVDFLGADISAQQRDNRKYCSRQCAWAVYLREHPEYPDRCRGVNASRWGGGKFKDGRGYVMELAPRDHPVVQRSKRKYVPEHRLVMERVLGRYLESHETVHHKNGIRDDNRPENLELWREHQPRGQRAHEQKHCPTCTCGTH